RAFEMRDPVPAIVDEFLSELGAGGSRVDELDDGLDLLAQILVRHADNGDIEDGRVGGQKVLGLLGVDVDTARNDHVRLAVGEIEVAFRVDMPDVAKRAGLTPIAAAFGGLYRVPEVLERSRAAEPDGPVRSRWALVAFIVQDEQLAEDWLPDCSRVREPLRRVAERESVGLSTAVVLGNDRTEPADHCALDLHGPRRGGVDEALE